MSMFLELKNLQKESKDSDDAMFVTTRISHIEADGHAFSGSYEPSTPVSEDDFDEGEQTIMVRDNLGVYHTVGEQRK